MKYIYIYCFVLFYLKTEVHEIYSFLFCFILFKNGNHVIKATKLKGYLRKQPADLLKNPVMHRYLHQI